MRATVWTGGLAAASLTLGLSCGQESALRAGGAGAASAPSERHADSATRDVLIATPRFPRRRVVFTIDCSAAAIPISPLIYGIAYDITADPDHTHQWQLGPTIRRWGGNSSTRYNWALGNAWNAGQDWFFENVNKSTSPGFSYMTYLQDNVAHGVKTALTVPTIGWVAKDTTSYSFPVSLFGAQDGADPWKQDAGNGLRSKKPLVSPPPMRTSVMATPEFMRQWVAAIRASDAQTGVRTVHQYILDNEPALWHVTHRDVHSDPLTYDELLDRTQRYGTAIRTADPDAVIAGPAEWGWPNYFYSARDLANPGSARPDRLQHGNVPLVAWYLKKLQEYEQRTGIRALDVLDLHFYPQGDRVTTDDDSSAVAALRIRETRALWDPDYVDESWINDRIQLLPRMKDWIAENYPGRGISIGEWNFGGERHMSGGLAVAEVLGRFGRGEVTSAFYWTYPPPDTPAYWAFRAYRNFDGNGGRFLDWSLAAQAGAGASIFASRDATQKHLVAIVLNFSPDTGVDADVDLHTCGTVSKVDEHTYTQSASGYIPGTASAAAGAVVAELPPYSINVLDVRLADGG